MALIFPLVLLGIMYAFLIVPQRKRQRAHAELMRSIGPGDEVLTSGGIYGGVTEVDGDDLYLEIAPDVEIKISRRAVAERVSPAASSTLPAAPAAESVDAGEAPPAVNGDSEPVAPEPVVDEPQKGSQKK
jgi:preprotein translocase subunit YajC